LALVGCDDDQGSKPKPIEHPFRGETVTLSVPQGLGFRDDWKLLLDEWSQQTGGAYRIVEYAAGAGTDLSPAGGDLVVMPLTALGDDAANGRLSRIPAARLGSESSLKWLDFFSGLRERVLSVGGGPTVIPFSCPVLACYVRRDLLEKAGLKPPETWDEYLALVESAPKWAPGLAVVEPWGRDFRATMFLARALPYVKNPGSYSVFFDIDTGGPLIDSPGFVKALEQAIAALGKMPSEVKKLSPADCRRWILSGKAALAISSEPGQSDDRSSARAPGIALSCVRLPGMREVYNRKAKSWEATRDGDVNYATLAPFSGLGAGVSKGIPAARSEAAWSLVAFLSADRYEQAFAKVPKSVCRESQLVGAISWASPDLRPEELGAYLGATADCLRQANLTGELPVVGHAKFRQALAEGLTTVLDGKSAPEAALKTVGERWKAIAGEIGVERVRDSYRSCLGIPPVIKLPEP